MSMHSVYKCLAGNATYVMWRPRIRSALKVSILQMALFILMVSMALSGFFAINASRHTTCSVSVQTNNHQPSGPSSVPSMNAESSKRVPVKISTKRVTVSVTVVREKHSSKHLR